VVSMTDHCSRILVFVDRNYAILYVIFCYIILYVIYDNINQLQILPYLTFISSVANYFHFIFNWLASLYFISDDWDNIYIYIYIYIHIHDRLCGLVVRVLGYRSGGPGSIPGTTKKKSSGSGTGSTQPREYN
jgi:hypothetical protein